MTAADSCIGEGCKGKRPKRPVEVIMPKGGYCGACNAARLDKMEKEAVSRFRSELAESMKHVAREIAEHISPDIAVRVEAIIAPPGTCAHGNPPNVCPLCVPEEPPSQSVRKRQHDLSEWEVK